MKVLTFIIPAYNSEAFLDKCISSMIIPEVLEKLEILVVNDGSTDATAEIAEKYCAEFPNVVRLISQENKGHGGALNTGCAAARGKYLKVIDADDWVESQNLSEFIQLLEQCNSDVVLTHYHTINISTGEIKKWRSYPKEFKKNYTFGDIIPQWNNFEWCLTFHGITYRTDFYQKYAVSLLEHVFYEDNEYAAFPCCYAQNVMCFDLFVYDYRIGDVNQSVSNANRLKRIGHTESVIRRMTDSYHVLPEGDGKFYAAMKTQGVILSYLVIALLINPNKKEGREQAKSLMDYYRTEIPELYELTKWKYSVFYAMNRLHIGKSTWDKIVNTKIYNRIQRKPRE